MNKALEALDRLWAETFDNKETSSMSNRSDRDTIKQSLIKLQGLEKFKATFDRYELSKKQDFISYENWQECEKELKEMEVKVKRYFELREILYDCNGLKSHKQCDLDEYTKLEKQLEEWGESK